MAESDKNSKSEDPSYFIDLDWFQENGRSFAAITRHCLCSACQKRLASESSDMEATSLIANIKDCCSKVPGFINIRLPLLEKIFRLILSRENKPLALTELVTELTSCSDTAALLSSQTLKSLLDNDRYYGFSRRSRAK